MADLYSPDAAVWLPDEEDVWIGGKVVKHVQGSSLVVRSNDGKELTIDVTAEENLPPLRNPEILIGSADLTHLSYLHEPAVLHNLEVRFCEGNDIYTYCGIVLVVLNPYARLPIFEPEVIEQYRGADVGELDPHVFAVAEDAFKCLSRNSRNQSIIVSGESGAGKTVNAKFAMRYFAAVSGASDETQIEKKILASNPVMEALGNAKTTRNDNSSRFGKYIEIVFNKSDEICGASMRTYLLEKSRLVHQAAIERNYHVFYQLCSVAETPDIEHLELGAPEDFFFTNQGGDSKVADVDDAAEYEATKEAMTTLGIPDETQQDMFGVLAGLLHLGNVEVVRKSRRGDDAKIDDDDTHLQIASALFGVDDKMLRKWLTSRKIQTGREVFIKPMMLDEAKFSLHALAKHIYAHIFDWMVVKLNHSLEGMSAKMKDRRFIGVLDIYGFETFKVNSFEQFCINYANEKLQQLFNLHIFKLEQEEYVREKIQWSFIDFYDNQPCIDLIEEKLGILSLLDEECKVPKGNDESWVIKMYQAFGEHHHFSKPRLSETAFIVKHYAGDVPYEVDGFVSKNKDSLSDEHMAMLLESSVPIVGEMFAQAVAAKAAAEAASASSKSGGGGGSMKKKKSNRATVGTQFQSSLTSLMTALNATEPHYIRCLKPNDNKAKFEYNRPRCMEQLKACGVLETVRISAAGFPSRWSYPEFLERYAMLAANCGRNLNRTDKVAACKTIVAPLISDEDKLQFGLTKIFFRAGQVAYLEKLRSDKRGAAAVVIQKHVKGMQRRKQYLRMRRAAIKIQANVRGWLDRQLVEFLREDNAAIRIQTAFRRWQAVAAYKKTRAAILVIQAFARGMAGRSKYRELLRNDRALRIQTAWRGMVARRSFARTISAVIMLQSHYRRVLAFRIFKQLRAEAKSVSGIKSKNKALEAQVLDLHSKLKAAAEESAAVKELLELQETSAESSGSNVPQEEHEALQAELAAAKAEIIQLKEESSAQVVQFGEEAAAQEAVYSKEVTRLEDELKQAAAGAAAETSSTGSEDVAALQSKLDAADAEIARLVEASAGKGKPASAASTKLLPQPPGSSSSDPDGSEADTSLEGKLAAANAEIARLASAGEQIETLLLQVETSHAEKEELVAEVEAAEAKQAELASQVKLLSAATNSNGVLSPPATPASGSDETKKLPQPPGKQRRSKPAPPGGGKSLPAPGGKSAASTPDAGRKSLPVPGGSGSSGKALPVPGGKSLPVPGGKSLPVPGGKALPVPAGSGSKPLPGAPGARSGRSTPTVPGAAALQSDNAKLVLANKALLDQVAEFEKSQSKVQEAAAAEANVALAAQAEEAAAHAKQAEKLAGELQVALDAKSSAEITVQASVDQIKTLEKEAKMWKKKCQEAGAVSDDGIAEVEELQRQLKEVKAAETRLKRNLATVESAAKTQQTVGNLLKSTMDRTNKEVTELRAQLQSKKKLLAQYSSGKAPSSSSSSSSVNVKRLQAEVQALSAQELNTREKLEDALAKIEMYEKERLEGRSGTGSSSGGGYMQTGPGSSSATASQSDDGVGRRGTGNAGMIQIAESDVSRLINDCVRQLDPAQVSSSIPGISTHIIFMCILYADSTKNGALLQALLFNAMGAIKEVVSHSAADIGTLAFWTSNTYQLLSNMRQYSGEAQFKMNSAQRKQATFNNFDLKQYRRVLVDLFTQIFCVVIKNVEHQVEPLVVPAVLDHESIPGLEPASPTRPNNVPACTINSLLELVDSILKHLIRANVPSGVIRLVFQQVFYFINCKLVNSFMIMKDYCKVFKGMQIRQNLTMIEEWARDNKLDITSSLMECIQISQLLQMEKSSVDHAGFILSNCNRLNSMQLQKVLQMYTPTQPGEKPVPAKLIKAVVAKATKGADYMMDDSKKLQLQFPYEPCAPDFSRIELPAALSLDSYLTLL